MEIRELRADDFDRNFLETLATLSKVELSAEQGRQILLQRPSNQFTFVALENGRVVGTTSLFIERKFIHSGGLVGHIEDVVVSRDVQGRGVGALLVKHASGFAQAKGCYKVVLHCLPELVPFYERLGFRDFNIGMRLDFPT